MEETSSWLFKQPTGENGPFQELGVGGGHLRVGKSGEDLDAVRLCSPDWLHLPLDGAGVYGEEAVDGKEARLLGQLDNVAMRGDDALYSSREEAQPARVLGDAADEIYVDTYGRSPPRRPHLLQNPEDVPPSTNAAACSPASATRSALSGPRTAGITGFRHRPQKNLRLCVARLTYVRTLPPCVIGHPRTLDVRHHMQRLR